MPSTWRPAPVLGLSAMAPVMKIEVWTSWSTSQSTMAEASPTRPPMSNVSATSSPARAPCVTSRLGTTGVAAAVGRGVAFGGGVAVGRGVGVGVGLPVCVGLSVGVGVIVGLADADGVVVAGGHDEIALGDADAMAVGDGVVGSGGGEPIGEPAQEPATNRAMAKRAISCAGSLGCPRGTVITR
jgi:hypothetical protein